LSSYRCVGIPESCSLASLAWLLIFGLYTAAGTSHRLGKEAELA